MQWLSLLIPVIAIIVGIIKFRKALTWWEYIVVFAVPFLFILITTAIVENNIPKSTSVNNYYSTKAQYDERWDEWIVKECSKKEACGTESYTTTCGSGKNRHTCSKTRTKYCTRTWDCSYREEHSPRWGYYLNDGSYNSISQNEFEQMCSDWQNKKFIELNRHYYRIDGNRYECEWNQDTTKLRVEARPQEYENRLLATKNIMGFRNIDSIDIQRYGLYSSPSDNFSTTDRFQYIIGDNNQDAYKFISGKNGVLGKKLQLTMLLVVHHNKPSDVCEMQEAHWNGGKKNELILCVNERDGKVVNSKVITWAKNELLKVKVRDSLAFIGKYDALQSVKVLSHFAETMWDRRSFSEFDYIEVKMELKTWHYVMIWIIVILLSAGLGAWVVLNDINPRDKKYD